MSVWQDIAGYSSYLSCPAPHDTGYVEDIEGSKLELMAGCKVTQVGGTYSSQVLGWKNDWIIGVITKIGLASDNTIVPTKSELVYKKYDLMKDGWRGAINSLTMTLSSKLLAVKKDEATLKKEAVAAEKKEMKAAVNAAIAFQKAKIAKEERDIAAKKDLIASKKTMIGTIEESLGNCQLKRVKETKERALTMHKDSIKKLTAEIETSNAQVRKCSDQIAKLNGLTLLPG